jgi:hypothetical protein
MHEILVTVNEWYHFVDGCFSQYAVAPKDADDSWSIMILWLLLTYGVTMVLTCSRLLKPVRHWIGWKMLYCPMCIGWWVGLGMSLLGVSLARASALPAFLVPVADAFCSSAWCWMVHVVLVRLGAKEL